MHVVCVGSRENNVAQRRQVGTPRLRAMLMDSGGQCGMEGLNNMGEYSTLIVSLVKAAELCISMISS